MAKSVSGPSKSSRRAEYRPNEVFRGTARSRRVMSRW